MNSALHDARPAHTVREFCGAIYGAQCLVAAGEQGPRVTALVRYAGTLLDVLDVDLLEAGAAPSSPEIAAAARLRERYDSLVLALVAESLRQRAARSAKAEARRNARGRQGFPPRRPPRAHEPLD